MDADQVIITCAATVALLAYIAIQIYLNRCGERNTKKLEEEIESFSGRIWEMPCDVPITAEFSRKIPFYHYYGLDDRLRERISYSEVVDRGVYLTTTNNSKERVFVGWLELIKEYDYTVDGINWKGCEKETNGRQG